MVVPAGRYGPRPSLGLTANLALPESTLVSEPIEVTALRLPARFCCPARYFATIAVSDSLFHPMVRDWRSSHCPTACNHRTKQGLTGSVQNLSKRAIPNHSTALAGVFTHSALRLRGDPKPLRQRTSPNPEGWSSLPSHHGFTVRYGSLVRLRPTRFRITPNTLPCWLSHLNGVIGRSRTFTCKLLYLPFAPKAPGSPGGFSLVAV